MTMENMQLLFRPVPGRWTEKVKYPARGNGWYEDTYVLWKKKTVEEIRGYFATWQSDAERYQATDYRIVNLLTGESTTFLHPLTIAAQSTTFGKP